MKFESEYSTFHSWKCMWKCRLRNCGHFDQGEIELKDKAPGQKSPQWLPDTTVQEPGYKLTLCPSKWTIFISNPVKASVKVMVTFVYKSSPRLSNFLCLKKKRCKCYKKYLVKIMKACSWFSWGCSLETCAISMSRGTFQKRLLARQSGSS